MFRIFFGSIKRNRTRFYLPSTGAAGASPGFDSGWEETGSADRLKMVKTRISSAMSDKSITTLITPGDTLVRQYVSDPLASQTIVGNIRLYARSSEALATIDAVSRMVLKVVSGDGSSVTGILLTINDYSSGSEWNTSLRNKSFSDGDFPSSVIANSGDRLVLEIGFNHGAVISSATINFGDDSATDLTQDEIETAANNPWLEIGQVIQFYGGSIYNASITFSEMQGYSLTGLLKAIGSLSILENLGLSETGLIRAIGLLGLLRDDELNFTSRNLALGDLSVIRHESMIEIGLAKMIGNISFSEVDEFGKSGTVGLPSGLVINKNLAVLFILSIIGVVSSGVAALEESLVYTAEIDETYAYAAELTEYA